jgi:hypothetical protein
MLKKLFFVIIGVLLIAVVVSLGIKAAQDSFYVTWFGIASAILAPLAFAIIGYGFKMDERQLFQQLSKVPEIDKFIKEASTQEERIALRTGSDQAGCAIGAGLSQKRGRFWVLDRCFRG